MIFNEFELERNHCLDDLAVENRFEKQGEKMRNQHIAINNAPFGYAIIELVRKGADGAISCKLAELNQTFEYLTGWILYSKTGNIFVPQFTIGNEVIESLDNLLAVVLDEGAGFEIHKYFGQSRKWLKVQIRKHGEEHIIIIGIGA